MQKLRSREMVQAADDALMGDTANVQLDSLEMDNGRSVGCERLALEARESMRFSEALKNVGMSDRDARIAMAMVTARMVHPSSERAALNWLETNSATCSASPLMGTATSLSDIERSATSLSDTEARGNKPVS